MKKRLLAGLTVLLSLVLGAAIYVYYWYLPAFLLKKLPHNLAAEDVTFNLGLDQVIYHQVSAPSLPGCSKSHWLNAEKATINLHHFKPAAIEIDKARLFLEWRTTGKFCADFLPRRQVSSAMPSPLSVKFSQAQLVIVKAGYRLKNLQGSVNFSSGRFDISFKGRDRFSGRVKASGTYGSKKDSLKLSYYHEDISKLPTEWLDSSNYRFSGGKLDYQLKVQLAKNLVFDHKLRLADFSAKRIKTNALFSTKHTDYLKLISSKPGIVNLETRAVASQNDSWSEIMLKNQQAFRGTIRQRVKQKLSPFFFLKP